MRVTSNFERDGAHYFYLSHKGKDYLAKTHKGELAELWTPRAHPTSEMIHMTSVPSPNLRRLAAEALGVVA